MSGMPAVLGSPGEVRGPEQTTNHYPTHYQMFVNVLDFRESDFSANLSVSFNAQFEVHGNPGGFGADLQDRDTGGYAQAESNAHCIYKDCSVAFWDFSFSVRFLGLGAADFYPYDAWMFNLTLTTPLLFEANATNTDIGARSYLPGWEFKQTPTSRVVGSHGLLQGQIVVTMILQRAGWTVQPIRLVPIVLFFVLGLTAMIPSDDLSSKITVATAVIIFVAASVFTLGTSLPARSYGPSFAETVFFYLILLAAVYLAESIAEKRLDLAISNWNKKKLHTDIYDPQQQFIRLRDALRGVVPVIMQIATLALAVNWILAYTSSYANLTSIYWWSAVDAVETRYLPILAVAIGTSLNAVLYLLGKSWMLPEE